MELDFQDARLSSYTDAELAKYIESLPILHKFSSVVALSSRYLAKGYRQERLDDAVRAAEFASELGIRVPRIQRIVRSGRSCYCVMERIPGITLERAWPELDWLTSLRLALHLRRVVRRLRSAVCASAGSLATGKCRSYYLEDAYGLPPGATSDHVNAFLNFWANFTSLGPEVEKTPAEHAVCPRPVFSYNQPFVFTHHDLAPRNIMLDEQGRLWILDWDEAGYYPDFFEYAGLHNFIPHQVGWSRVALWRWTLFAWIAAGFHDQQARLLEVIRSRFTRFRPARRFNMKANGYAAVAGRADKND